MVARGVCFQKSDRSEDNDHTWVACALHECGQEWCVRPMRRRVWQCVRAHEGFITTRFFLAHLQHILNLVSGLVFQFEV